MAGIFLRSLLVGALALTYLLADPGPAGCAGSTDRRLHTGERAGEAVLDREFKLEYGQELTVKGEGLSVKFDALVNESRCPTGVNCVWEGDAQILIGARHAKGEPLKLELHTNQRFAQSGRYQQYVIKLVALDPYPKADVDTARKDYVATLLITKEP